MGEFKSIEQAADCIEATNLPNVSAAYKVASAQRMRKGLIDLHGLDKIERDARRQLAACKFIRDSLQAETIRKCKPAKETVG